MLQGRVNTRERALLFRSLQVLFDAGLSLPRSLRILSEQVETPSLKKALDTMERRIAQGQAFSSATKEFPFVFNDQCRRTLEVAEAAGALPVVLARLSEYEEKAYRTELMFRKTLIYPAWILLVCVAFVVWVPPFLFGELFDMLKTSGVALPWITRFVLGLSEVVGSPFFYLAMAVVLFFSGRFGYDAWQHPSSRYRLFMLLHKNGFVSQQLTAIASCRFARCLEMMSSVGVPLTQGLKLASNASGDPVLSRRMPRCIDALINGATLDQALEEANFFTETFLGAVKMGEESGAMADALGKVVLLFEVELEYRASKLVAMLEPVTMLIMGIIVAIFIVATMLPLMELIQAL